MLKGWLDRVWVPVVTFEMPKGLRPIQVADAEHPADRRHLDLRLALVVVRFAIGDPGRRVIMRGLRPLCHPRCRTFWLGHYRMDSSTPESRGAFLAKVEARLGRLPL